jgi:hypothetical protein
MQKIFIPLFLTTILGSLISCNREAKLTVETGSDGKPKTSVPINSANEIVGTYTLAGSNPGQSGIYIGSVTIEELDSGIQVLQSINDQIFPPGNGKIDTNGRLFVEFQGAGVEGTWTLLQNGTLEGTWKHISSPRTGKETWTPKD